MDNHFEKAGKSGEGFYEYKLLGMRLNSDFPFTNIQPSALPISPEPSKFDLSFTCSDSPPFQLNLDQGKLAFISSAPIFKGKGNISLFRFESFDLLRFESLSDFYLGVDRIDCHVHYPAYRPLAQELLFGTVLAFWLERKGIPVLHSAAVATGAGAVVFPSFSGDGKTTLAAAFLRAGAELLSDDILPMEEKMGQFWGRPGIPQLNLWPNQQIFFLDHIQSFEKGAQSAKKTRIPVTAAGIGTFCDDSKPLARFYLPNRYDPGVDEPEIKILPVSPAEAVLELTRFSFVPNIIESLGWQPTRLAFLSRLVKQAPVRRLVYPNGFEHLSRVVEAVLRDLEK